MVTGDNKGHVYEKKVFHILENKNMVDSRKSAGSGPETDMVFLHSRKKYNLEVKNNVTDPDYGQKRLLPVRRSGRWAWTWAKDEEITRHYTEAGVLDYLDRKDIVPNKYRKPDHEITMEDKKTDQKNFEDRTFTMPTDTFSLFYKGKAEYLQVGNGYGFFHLNEDVAGLGTEKFEGDFILRFRVKTHSSKPIYNYSFFAVLKCKGIRKKSEFNIENYAEQKFPPISIL